MAPKASAGFKRPLLISGVNDGARTRDRRNHNPELYQLSYAHHCYLLFCQTLKWRARQDLNLQPSA